jgi:bile acid:Na+ symporter, BASS family
VLHVGARVSEGILIVVLAIASTASAGIAAGLAGNDGAVGRTALAAIVAGNLILLPALAWLLARGLGAAAGFGLIVAAAAPGGSTGPLLAVIAGGDARFAARLFVVLTVAGTAGALAATLAVGPGGAAAVARAAVIVAATAIGPLAAGLALAARRRDLAVRVAPWLSRISLALLVVTIGLLAVRHAHRAALPDLAAATVIVAASLGLGALGGRGHAIATAQVSAVRNLTLALVVVAAVGAPPEATGAVLGYGLVMYLATGAVAIAARRRATLESTT